jgi:hypothetical protein
MKNIHQAILENLPANNRDGTYELIIGVPSEDDCDGHFRHSGCEIVDTLASNVVDVECVIFRRNIFGRIIERQDFEASVCSEVLDAYHNGSQYYQDDRGDWIPEWDINFAIYKKKPAIKQEKLNNLVRIYG